jgi:DNA-binding NarL/FixJ family response regulator
MAQRIPAATGPRRLSAVNGSFWPRGEQPARPAGTALHQTDPTSSARLRSPHALATGLSARERTVLSLLAEGCSTREIAGQLCYSERTIKNVLQEITSRLQLRNRTQAVAYAVRRGWI